MRRLLALYLTALGVFVAHAQVDLVAYSWTRGDIAFAYPAGWATPVEEASADALQVTLRPSTDAFSVTIEILQTPTRRPFDFMAERLSGAGITASAPQSSALGGLAALETREAIGSTKIGIARGTVRTDGSIVLVWAAGEPADADGMLAAFEVIASSLVFDAQEMPLTADGTRIDRIGPELLTRDTPAYGVLTADASAQLWRFEGRGGDVVSLYATDINRLETLNVRLRLAAPEGTVIAENDNHSGGAFYGLYSLYDSGLYDVTLPMDGVYSVAVESVFGEGVYGIGLRAAHRADVATEGATRLNGQLDDIFVNETWIFNGLAGSVYTITMFAEADATLDPALRLRSPSGAVIAENDDARDPSLGLNAQLVRVLVSETGTYRLEATRYAGEGEGAYEIVILATSG